MIITEAIRDGEFLKLKTNSPDSFKFVYGFKPGEYSITPAKKKRSNDANAYMWVLCDKTAAKIGLTPQDVYRRAIRDVGVFTPLPIKNEAVEDFTRIWEAHGTGWVLDVVDDSKIKGYKLCNAYQGSSTYDVAQMSRLIDYIVEDAKAMGIDTISERELSLMKEEYGKHSAK